MTTDRELRDKLLRDAFRMPSFQTMVSRKSSITNAFVNSVIPAIPPTLEQIDESLQILEMSPDDVRCAYCGDQSTEWDHLRPLVLNRRPTGYITEIANLVPACGKCNQSKGNKDWREWMLSPARRSPTGRNLPDVQQRIERIGRFTQWKQPIKLDFPAVIGGDEWERYWDLCEAVIDELRASQEVANELRKRAIAHLEAVRDAGRSR